MPLTICRTRVAPFPASAAAVAGFACFLLLNTAAPAQTTRPADPNVSQGTYPTPAVVPTSWEFDFSHAKPQRIVVQLEGQANPEAFWFLTYTVTNRTDREQTFLPKFEWLRSDGVVIRSDQGIPRPVFEAVRRQSGKSLLEPFHAIGGTLLIGEDQARDGVAIWRERDTRFGRFSIFVEGLSGETATVKVGDKSMLLRKVLQLNFHFRDDEVYPGEDEINAAETAQQWIMR